MDKDHAKEYKKLRSEIKKRSEAVSRAQKKQKKSKSGSNDQHIATKVKQIYLIRSTTYSYRESVADSVIQATGKVEFEDGL